MVGAGAARCLSDLLQRVPAHRSRGPGRRRGRRAHDPAGLAGHPVLLRFHGLPHLGPLLAVAAWRRVPSRAGRWFLLPRLALPGDHALVLERPRPGRPRRRNCKTIAPAHRIRHVNSRNSSPPDVAPFGLVAAHPGYAVRASAEAWRSPWPFPVSRTCPSPTAIVSGTRLPPRPGSRKWAGAKDKPNAKYRQAFAWYDDAGPDDFGSYKLALRRRRHRQAGRRPARRDGGRQRHAGSAAVSTCRRATSPGSRATSRATTRRWTTPRPGTAEDVAVASGCTARGVVDPTRSPTSEAVRHPPGGITSPRNRLNMKGQHPTATG